MRSVKSKVEVVGKVLSASSADPVAISAIFISGIAKNPPELRRSGSPSSNYSSHEQAFFSFGLAPARYPTFLFSRQVSLSARRDSVF